jgi:hypothetical protein
MGISGNRVLNHNAGSSLLKRAGIPVASNEPGRRDRPCLFANQR